MSWKQRWQDASFRGVRFLTEGMNTDIGRRAVVHEYPYQDATTTEDMGLKARKYTINAYVIGDDHDLQRTSLIQALEAPGPGDLIHPEYGLQSVVLESCTSSSDQQTRISKFNMVFVQAGKPRYPSQQRNTRAEVVQLQAKINTSLRQRLTGVLSSDMNILTLRTQVVELANVYRRSGYMLALAETGLPKGVTGADLLDLVTASEALDTALLAPIRTELPSLPDNWTEIPAADTETLPSINKGIGLLNQLQAASNSNLTPQSLLQHAYASVFSLPLIHSTRLVYDSVEQAQSLRQSLHSHLTTLAGFSNLDYSGLVGQFRDLLSVVDAAAEQQLATLPNVVYVKPKVEIPTLTLAWQQQQDASKADSIQERNLHILHPLFVTSARAVEILQ